MTMSRSLVKVAGAAFILFVMNGWINYSLMKPLDGASDAVNRFRYHLDDAVFIMLFVFIAIVFWAMFAVLPRERGYLYLGVISLLTSLQLYWDWDDKALLFGPIEKAPYGSLVFKCGIVFLLFSFIAYLLGTAKRPITRGLLWAVGVLWAMILTATLLSAADFLFIVLNRLFLVLVFLNMALCISQFLALLRRKEHKAELRWIASGFVLFGLVLLPDPVKDSMEQIEGHLLGYRHVFWQQCLEDTFPWALLSLLTVFGVVFFRRFIQTLNDNRAVTEEIRSKNEALQQEMDTRQRLDQLLSEMLRTYRVADWEKCVIREGQRFFQPHVFVLVKYDEADGSIRFEGADNASALEEEVGESLRSKRNRMTPGEAISTPSLVLGSAGGTDKTKLFLAVYSADAGPIFVEERAKFALLLMSKYVSIFYEYFQLLEGRLQEMEQRHAGESPWLSKLFMQMAEKERKRLASDLHDEVLQELLHIRRLLDRAPTGQWSPEDQEHVRLGLDNAEFMIRETSRELMPSFLTDQGVLYAISRLVEKARLRADFQLEFTPLPLTAPLGDEQTTTIYRVVQELINNAMKHSEASRVALEVGERGGELHIRYTDDGKGMETGIDFSSTNRFGLRGIAERIRMVGGEVAVKSGPGQGVAIRCKMPI
ncbi:ATP-binding protein [Paenibacillus mesophilus]|uniref:ATP-binding protein n=1 Tax=Paenibacillus mesophilus TaxID=2582849 RepID=UPI0013052284|nr:ATP-binding protein [Paenibacillus mesophilus]